MGAFSDRVFAVVKQIPRGKVATYGQIARIIGAPRSARYVGYACAQTLLLEQILRQSLATASYSKMGAWQPDLLLEVLVFSKQCYKKKVSNLTMRIKLS